MKFTHLDLFSGIGGFSVAFEECGFETLAFSEICPNCNMILNAHWDDVPNLGSVDLIDEKAIKSLGRVDVLTGGVPCQPASSNGQRRGYKDDRWKWPQFIELVGRIRPRFALAENPTGILTVDGGLGFNQILSGLGEIGYDVWWETVSAASFGSGHRRERVYLVIANSNHSTNKTKLRRQRSKMGRIQFPSHLRDLPAFSGREKMDWWMETHSGIPVLGDGLSKKLASAIDTCVGNSVVPQVIIPFAEAFSSALAGDL